MTAFTIRGSASIGTQAFTPTATVNVQDAALPRALCTGVMTRAYAQLRNPNGSPGPLYPLVMAGAKGGVVLDPSWAELQPNPGALSASAIATLRAQLDDCRDLGLKVRLRVRLGEGAPAWVRADPLVGAAPEWATSHNVGPTWQPAPGDTTGKQFLIPGGMVRCWRPRYWELYRDFQVRLAAAIGSHLALAEVVLSLAATQFQEPCILQLFWQPNCDAAVSTGFSNETWEQMFIYSFEAHKEIWALPHGVAAYTAWNPMGDIIPAATPSGFKYRAPLSPPSVGVAKTIRMMRETVRVLGPFGVIGNNSFTSPEPNGQYNAMYAEHERLRALGQPIAFQTETLDKINADSDLGVQGVLARARDIGANGAELPIGCQIRNAQHPLSHVTPEIAAEANQSLRDNAAGMFG